MASLPLLAACLVGCTSDPRSGSEGPRSTPTTARPERASETIESRVVPVPDSVAAPRFPWWSADGERLLFSGVPEDRSRVEVLTIEPDGSDLACLTCGISPGTDQPLLKPIAFPDGKRVAVRVGDQSPLRAADHAILECTPSVADCQRAELVPLEIPHAHDPAVTQDQRELRVAPDGEHVAISQVRTSTTGDPRLIAVVARLERTADSYRLDDPRVVSDRGELKSFTPDGEAVLVAEFTPGPFDLANPDVVRIDLASGATERVTYAADYDEPVELSPDGSSYVVGSGRGSGLFAAVSQLRRPSLFGTALDPLTAALFAGYRPALLEGWLVDRGAEARGDDGQRIPAPPGGYDGRPIWNWRPDGTAITYWEGRGAGFETDPTDTRLVVSELPDREPVAGSSAPEVADPTWAPALVGYVPDALPDPASRSGRDQGSVAVEVTHHDDGSTVSLTYRGFSDDGEWIIDGTERAERHGATTTYTVDLRLSGDHQGYLRADAEISVGGIDGEITSSVDGRVLTLPPEPGGGG